MRYAFWHVFATSNDGHIHARRPIRLGGVSLRAGDRICPAVEINGFNPYRFTGQDLEADQRKGDLVIQAVYPQLRRRGIGRDLP